MRYNVSNFIVQTVEAEITAAMPLQRACGAENQARNTLSNGPLRVQSNGAFPRVFCNVLAYVSCRDMLVSCKAHGSHRESRWHRG